MTIWVSLNTVLWGEPITPARQHDRLWGEWTKWVPEGNFIYEPTKVWTLHKLINTSYFDQLAGFHWLAQLRLVKKRGIPMKCLKHQQIIYHITHCCLWWQLWSWDGVLSCLGCEFLLLVGRNKWQTHYISLYTHISVVYNSLIEIWPFSELFIFLFSGLALSNVLQSDFVWCDLVINALWAQWYLDVEQASRDVVPSLSWLVPQVAPTGESI